MERRIHTNVGQRRTVLDTHRNVASLDSVIGGTTGISPR
jgi:hypothetical protein